MLSRRELVRDELLELTKLGTERRNILRWLSKPTPRHLIPMPLMKDSPNLGLTSWKRAATCPP